eukprot:Lithocolla_globosa_v1_NODE_29_length_9070_cov_27.690371.p5 type:complete len:112 gc:universal NODE_29_length_9070_cov_27.690371:7960-7625(-)
MLIELAIGEPPNAHEHPMRVLMKISKDPAPKLEGHFSPKFKSVVDMCLQKDPSKRGTVDELLLQPFVRGATKLAYLTELIERYERWKDDSEEEEVVEEEVVEEEPVSTVKT